jgi:uncharacterized protein (UPF0261 family)
MFELVLVEFDCIYFVNVSSFHDMGIWDGSGMGGRSMGEVAGWVGTLLSGIIETVINWIGASLGNK